MNDSHELKNASVKAPGYLLLFADTNCPACRRMTRVAALAVPRAHQWLHADDEDGEAEVWQAGWGAAILFRIESLAPTVEKRLRQLAPNYRPACAPSVVATLWLNHCAHCNALLDEDELHCEPGGAFMPTSAAAARAIERRCVGEPLQAVAAGYAPDPEAALGE